MEYELKLAKMGIEIEPSYGYNLEPSQDVEEDIMSRDFFEK